MRLRDTSEKSILRGGKTKNPLSGSVTRRQTTRTSASACARLFRDDLHVDTLLSFQLTFDLFFPMVNSLVGGRKGDGKYRCLVAKGT